MFKTFKLSRWFGLVLALCLTMAGLCLIIVSGARLSDTPTSCLEASDISLPLLIDPQRQLLMNARGSLAQGADYHSVELSPDRRYLAYVKIDTDEQGQIIRGVYLQDRNRTALSRPRPILENIHLADTSQQLYLSWSPDSHWLLASWTEESGASPLVFTDPSSGQQIRPPTGNNLTPDGWTGDGAYYGFLRGGAIVLWSRDSHQFIHTGIKSDGFDFSPVGHLIYFYGPTDRSKRALTFYSPGEETRHEFPLPDNFEDLQPSFLWSPDGQHLLIESLTSKGVGSSYSWVNFDEYNADGTAEHIGEGVDPAVTENASVGPTALWSGDSRRIMFMDADDNGAFSIWAYDNSTHHSEMWVANAGVNLYSVDNAYLMTFSNGHTVMMNMATGQRSDIPQDLTGEWAYLHISPDGHVLAAPYNSSIELFDLDSSRALDYAPEGTIFEAKWIWSPDSKQVAILYRLGSDSREYTLDIVSTDGTVLRRQKLPDSVMRVPLYQFSAGQSPFYWTACGG